MQFIRFYTYFLLLTACLLCHLTAFGQRSSILLPDCRDSVFINEFNVGAKRIKNEALFIKKSDSDSVGAIFKKEAIFDSTYFTKQADFSDAMFEKRASFNKAYFTSWADFSGTYFTERVDFSESHFTAFADFRYTRFSKEANFKNVRFTRGANFDNAGLPQSLNLEGLRLDSLEKDIDFRQCHLDTGITKCIITLRYTDVSKLILPAHLFTVRFKFTENDTKQTRSDEIARVYEQLIKKSRDLGLMSSAQDWDIEYKKSIYKEDMGVYAGSLINRFLERWWNFGYDKWRVLWLWMPAFYVLFSVINFLKLDCMVENVYHDEELGRNFYFKYGSFEKKRHKLAYAFFYTAVIYFNFKLRHEAINYRNPLGLFYLYMIYCVGTLHVAFGVLGYILKT